MDSGRRFLLFLLKSKMNGFLYLCLLHFKKKMEQENELQKFVVDTAKESDKYSEQIILNAPVIEEKTEEILILKFTLKGTRTKLRELKQFLESGGYDYE